MSLPREFENTLAEVEDLCVKAETYDLSVLEVLEMMKPISKSPLLYAFPFICDYINACDALLDGFSTLLLRCHDIMVDSPHEDFVEIVIGIFESQNASEVSKIIRDYRAIPRNCKGVQINIWIHDNEIALNFFRQGLQPESCRHYRVRCLISRDIPIAVYGEDIYRFLSSRADIYCKNKGPSFFVRADIQKRISDLYGTWPFSNHVMAFDPRVCRQDATQFRLRAEANCRIGQHAANIVRYKPGNEGYDETASHFADLQL